MTMRIHDAAGWPDPAEVAAEAVAESLIRAGTTFLPVTAESFLRHMQLAGLLRTFYRAQVPGIVLALSRHIGHEPDGARRAFIDTSRYAARAGELAQG